MNRWSFLIFAKDSRSAMLKSRFCTLIYYGTEKIVPFCTDQVVSERAGIPAGDAGTMVAILRQPKSNHA